MNLALADVGGTIARGMGKIVETPDEGLCAEGASSPQPSPPLAWRRGSALVMPAVVVVPVAVRIGVKFTMDVFGMSAIAPTIMFADDATGGGENRCQAD